MGDFEKAQKDVNTLSKKPANSDMLILYSHFKQATVGDVRGTRPGLMNVTGRLKYDAWAKLKGMAVDVAKTAYIAKVKALLAADGK
jgi:acyl-CoA-binding protein